MAWTHEMACFPLAACLRSTCNAALPTLPAHQAMYNLGVIDMQAEGLGNGGQPAANAVPRGPRVQRAMDLFRRAADQGFAPALNGLGLRYMHGDPAGGLEKNETLAAELFKKSAAQGSADGNYNLGVLYKMGLGVEQDGRKAVECFSIAAGRHHAAAAFALAEGYFDRNSWLAEYGMSRRKASWNTPAAIAPREPAEGQSEQLALTVMTKEGLVLRSLPLPLHRHCPTALTFLKNVAEMGPLADVVRDALDAYLAGDHRKALAMYESAAEMGFSTGQINAAWLRAEQAMAPQQQQQQQQQPQTMLPGPLHVSRTAAMDHVHWRLSQAAAQGDARSMVRVGHALRRGELSSERMSLATAGSSTAAAMVYYTAAADRGDDEGAFHVASELIGLDGGGALLWSGAGSAAAANFTEAARRLQSIIARGGDGFYPALAARVTLTVLVAWQEAGVAAKVAAATMAAALLWATWFALT